MIVMLANDLIFSGIGVCGKSKRTRLLYGPFSSYPMTCLRHQLLNKICRFNRFFIELNRIKMQIAQFAFAPFMEEELGMCCRSFVRAGVVWGIRGRTEITKWNWLFQMGQNWRESGILVEEPNWQRGIGCSQRGAKFGRKTTNFSNRRKESVSNKFWELKRRKFALDSLGL